MREEAVTFSGGADGAVDAVCGRFKMHVYRSNDHTINFLHGIVKFSQVYLVLVR